MSQRFAPALALPFLAVALAAQSGNGLVVQPDPQNVVANHLVGTWQLDANLNKRLGHRGGDASLGFRADPEALAKVPAPLAVKLKDQRIFLAGWLRRGAVEHPFLLTVVAGNPHLVWFRERSGEPFGDAESCNLALVRGEAPSGDLLFVGGDHDNQSFAAYGRESDVRGALTAEASIEEMLRLIEAGKKLEFVKRFALPADLERMEQRGDALEKVVEGLDEERIGRIVQALQFAAKSKPEATEDGDLLTWKLPEEQRAKGPDQVRLRRVDGRWYLCN